MFNTYYKNWQWKVFESIFLKSLSFCFTMRLCCFAYFVVMLKYIQQRYKVERVNQLKTEKFFADNVFCW